MPADRTVARERIEEGVREGLGDRCLESRWASPKRLWIDIAPRSIRDAVACMYGRLGARFNTATGFDAVDAFEILYHFAFDSLGVVATLRVRIPERERPEIDSVADLLPAANWIERELFDLLGIRFLGHPDPRRLLLSDDWPEGVYPLRRQA
ncbi:MAG: NADH-quinone oxidoreductase subunit C [Planctomycetes bacterium]|nr:NADH-quinone oxidoreductase subunit C [Planctomycetota bacterium]